MSDVRVYLSARPKGSRKGARRVGRNRRTGKFLWLGTPWARILKKRGLLTGTMPAKDVKKFHAWCAARGLEPRTWQVRTKADLLVSMALAEVGITEQPLGSNRGPRVDWYRRATTLFVTLKSGWPWCCAFVARMSLQAGYKLPRAARTASVWAFTEWARRAGRIVHRAPQPGDVVVLLAEGKHIGFVERYDAKNKIVHTVEGNTTPDGKYGSQYEGTAVAPKERALGEVVHVISLGGL